MAFASAAPKPKPTYSGVAALAPSYVAPSYVAPSYVPPVYSAPVVPAVPQVYSAAPVVSSGVYPYSAVAPAAVSASAYVAPVSYGSGFFPQYSGVL